MESNKDEALRCLAIAQRHRDAGNLSSARKFCQKSISLFSTPLALELLDKINSIPESQTESEGNEPGVSSSSSGTKPAAASSGVKNRFSKGTAGGMGGDKRSYTPEQHSVVKRVRACKVEEYYEILEVKRDCEDVEIKKAYRKLALALHPDKNGAPGADEAFKMVSKAFQVLSDPQKRAAFDQHGADPESRFAGHHHPSDFGNVFSNGSFQGEMTPEDLFNMFFGGGANMSGMSSSPFGGPIFTASFGPDGFRTNQPRRRQTGTSAQANARGGDGETGGRSMLINLLPFIILFGLSLLNALPNLFTTQPVPDPQFSFTSSRWYNGQRTTNDLGIRYYINADEFVAHPAIKADLMAAKALGGVSSGKASRGKALAKFEAKVEHAYKQELYSQCHIATVRKDRLIEQEIGFFGFGTDWEKVKAIKEEKIPSCEELGRLGIQIS